MDFWIDIGVTVMLRVLQSGKVPEKYRKAFLKVFRAIASYYKDDPEFTIRPNTGEGGPTS